MSLNSASDILAVAGCVSCLTNGEKTVLITQASLTWLAFVESGGVRPVTPWTPQQALDSANGPCAKCLDSWSQNTIITNTSMIWIGLVLSGDVRPAPSLTPQDVLADSGCVRCLTQGDKLTIRAYSAWQQINWMQETNLSPQEVLAASGCVRCLTSGDQNTIQTIAALELVDYIDLGGCPPGVIPPIPVPVDVIWGNYIWDDTPAAPPTFTEADFIGVNALFVDRNLLSTLTRAGVYNFAARAGARQVMVMPDELGAPSFTVAGNFQWQLTPSPNTRCQTLTVNGKVCGVYFTSEQNAGGGPVTCA